MQHKRWHAPGAVVVHQWELTTGDRERARNPLERYSLVTLNLEAVGLRDWQLAEMATATGFPRARLADRSNVREHILKAMEDGRLVALRPGVGQPVEAVAKEAPTGTSLLAKLSGKSPPDVRKHDTQSARRSGQNDVTTYAGNRPDPSSSTDPVYALRSSTSRIIQVGDRVDYHLEQTMAAIQSADSHLGIRWQAINDPAAVQAAGIPATVDGPTDRMQWNNLTANAAGLHTIKAWVSLDETLLGELTYRQQVVSTRRSPVQVPSNTTASPLATMGNFIDLVRRIESAYGGYPWQDVVSRIRKEYYPGPGGGPYSGIIKDFTWDDLIDEQEILPGLEVPPVAMADVAAIRRSQTVTTKSGETIDIGHILTGVDSFDFPPTCSATSTRSPSRMARTSTCPRARRSRSAWRGSTGPRAARTSATTTSVAPRSSTS